MTRLATQSTAPAPAFEVLAQLAAQLGRELIAHGWTVSTVESCTGGLIAAALTEVAGSSAWFERGFVTYSNEAKTTAVEVPAALIAAHGAVSEPVAAAMAHGGLLASKTQIAVSVTGVAGPSGGSVEKPVGTVCFGWAYWATAEMAVPQGHAMQRQPIVHTVTCHFDGDRAAVRRKSVRHALQGLTMLLPGHDEAALG
jgi:nicotinamide-nucleotide amidase